MKPLRVGVPLIQSQLSGGAWIAGLYYVRNCLNALALLPAAQVPSVFAFLPDDVSEPLIFPERASAATWLTQVRIPAEVVRADPTKLAGYFAHYECDLVFPLTSLPKVPLPAAAIGWIPDFQHRHHPEFFSYEEHSIRNLLHAFLVGNCERIACSSGAVREDLARFYPGLGDKGVLLRFVSLFAEDSLRIAPGATLERLGIGGPYVYLPNQLWVHKNHKVVFEAWSELARRGVALDLVCSGKADDYRFPGYRKELEARIDELSLGDRVRMLGLVPREDQIQLFRGARLVLQPSLFEGWSTTIEEAKSLGKPLVVSDLPVHREQCGSSAQYFDKADPGSLADAVERALVTAHPGHDPAGETPALAEAGERARAFATDLVRAFREAVDARQRAPYGGRDRALILPLLVDMARQFEASHADRKELVKRVEATHAEAVARQDVIERILARLRALRDVLEGARPNAWHGLASRSEIRRVRQVVERALRELTALISGG